jgi:hypothetical protein
MHGPLAVQHMLVPGCKPVGSKVMTVTAAAHNYVLSLDGKPAADPVSKRPLLTAIAGWCLHS